MRRTAATAWVVTVGALALACGGARADGSEPSSPAPKPSASSEHAPCASGAEKAARTGYAGAKTGVTTAIEGVKTFGESAGGLVKGGPDEARAKWKDGAKDTKKTAREGRAETKREAHAAPCK